MSNKSATHNILDILQLPKIGEIKKLLEEKQQNIIIVSHRNPDGDAMGSSCALYNYLLKMGHEVTIVVPNTYPSYINWMVGIKNALVFDWNKKKCIDLFKRSTILFALDFNDLSRIQEFEKYLMPVKSYKVLIDHHPNPGNFADLAISDTSVSSASELVYLFMKALNHDEHLDKDIAECVYSGIMTDTGCFSFNSSRTQTFEIVAELLKLGIDKDKVYNKVYNNYSYDRLKLMGFTLFEKMTYYPEYNAACISLSQEDMKKYNFKVGDSEGFVNIPLSIKGVKFSALFSEKDDIVKVSLRSTGDFAVNTISSKHYGGGGHCNAAGGVSNLSLEQTLEGFKDILEEFKNELIDD